MIQDEIIKCDICNATLATTSYDKDGKREGNSYNVERKYFVLHEAAICSECITEIKEGKILKERKVGDKRPVNIKVN